MKLLLVLALLSPSLLSVEDVTCTIKIKRMTSTPALKRIRKHKVKKLSSRMLTETDSSLADDKEYWRVDAECSNINRSLHPRTTITCDKSYDNVNFDAKIGKVSTHKELPLKDDKSYIEIVQNVELRDKLDLSSSGGCGVYLKNAGILEVVVLGIVWLVA